MWSHFSMWIFFFRQLSSTPTSLSLSSCLTNIMPFCFCVSHGCSSARSMDPISHQPRGKNVNTCTYKAHSVTDRQAALRAAEQNTEAAIDTQIKEISTYLSACVLTDEVSGPLQSPGSSLWLRCDTFQLKDKPIATPERAHPQLSTPLPSTHPGSRRTSLHSPPRQAGSRHSQESEILTSLAVIEVEVGTLYHEALNSLDHIGKPSSSGPPSSFPLADLFLLSEDLKSRLEIITFKGPAVLELKNLIFLKLQNIHHKLKIAKKVWNEELANIRAMKTLIYGLPCETGEVLVKVNANLY